MKRYILVLFLFLFTSGYAQTNINNYKYVIVPEKFGFLKENDQYSLNSITKGLLETKGFTVYFDNAEVPGEIANNKCSSLSADVLNKGGMFTTTLILVLKDCHGNVVFTSKPGKSREKDYAVSYNFALRDAFTSLDHVSYSPIVAANGAVQSSVVTNATPATPGNQPAVTNSSKTTEAASNGLAGTLYAQAIPNGYQLIDTTPKKVLTLLKTSVPDYFIASNNTFNGIVLKINNDWFFEYYNNGKLISEQLQVKF